MVGNYYDHDEDGKLPRKRIMKVKNDVPLLTAYDASWYNYLILRTMSLNSHVSNIVSTAYHFNIRNIGQN